MTPSSSASSVYVNAPQFFMLHLSRVAASSNLRPQACVRLVFIHTAEWASSPEGRHKAAASRSQSSPNKLCSPSVCVGSPTPSVSNIQLRQTGVKMMQKHVKTWVWLLNKLDSESENGFALITDRNFEKLTCR